MINDKIKKSFLLILSPPFFTDMIEYYPYHWKKIGNHPTIEVPKIIIADSNINYNKLYTILH